MVGLAGFGSIAVAHRPPGCDNGQAVGNPHCDDDHDDDDNGNGNGGGHHHHGGSLISIDLGDIDLDVLEIAISKVLAVVDVDVLEVEDVTVLAKDVIDVMADANIQDVTGVDL